MNIVTLHSKGTVHIVMLRGKEDGGYRDVTYEGNVEYHTLFQGDSEYRDVI